MAVITEQSVKIKADLPQRDPTKKQEVFYNPTMKSNRNISILLLNSISNKNMMLADPLAGSGVRSIRFIKELKKGKIKQLFVNDRKENFLKTFNGNLLLNKIERSSKIKVGNDGATPFLLNQHCEDFCGYFDYIDIDPFGSPNPFISAAIMKLKRMGILAITATDTAALTGTYPKVTKRKYWAASLKNYMMHETGLRILIRKVQLQGIQFDKALNPILAYHKDHYFRIYFKCEKGKEKCDRLIRKHQYLLFCHSCLNFKTSNYNLEKCVCGNRFNFAGPLWAGKLFDSKLLKKMVKNNTFDEEKKFLELLEEESKIDQVGFYDLHIIAKKYKQESPKVDAALECLKGVRTHFSPNGIKSKKEIKKLILT